MKVAAQALYFGKLPSRGDFVRSSAGSSLIRSIDQWMSQTMGLLSQDPAWKLKYDAAAQVQFAILGLQSRTGLVGHLVASRDASGRRFPFVLAASFELAQPEHFIPYSPWALAPLWQRLDEAVSHALSTSDFALVQDELVGPLPEIEMRADPLRDAYKRIAQQQTIGEFETALSRVHPQFSLRQTVLALGLLLQPVLSQGHSQLSKGLVLPLPADPAQITSAALVWVDLIARFFKKSAAEIALFVTAHRQLPVLVVGFHGANASTLRSVLDADASQFENVAVSNAEWIEDWLDRDHGVRRLSDAMSDSSLSVAQVANMYRETFLGE